MRKQEKLRRSDFGKNHIFVSEEKRESEKHKVNSLPWPLPWNHWRGKCMFEDLLWVTCLDGQRVVKSGKEGMWSGQKGWKIVMEKSGMTFLTQLYMFHHSTFSTHFIPMTSLSLPLVWRAVHGQSYSLITHIQSHIKRSQLFFFFILHLLVT